MPAEGKWDSNQRGIIQDLLISHTNHPSARSDVVQGSGARTSGLGFSRLGETPETGSCVSAGVLSQLLTAALLQPAETHRSSVKPAQSIKTYWLPVYLCICSEDLDPQIRHGAADCHTLHEVCTETVQPRAARLTLRNKHTNKKMGVSESLHDPGTPTTPGEIKPRISTYQGFRAAASCLRQQRLKSSSEKPNDQTVNIWQKLTNVCFKSVKSPFQFPAPLIHVSLCSQWLLTFDLQPV